MHTPAYIKLKFKCPHCREVHPMRWWFCGEEPGAPAGAEQVAVVTCEGCQGYTVWVGPVCVFPDSAKKTLTLT